MYTKIVGSPIGTNRVQSKKHEPRLVVVVVVIVIVVVVVVWLRAEIYVQKSMPAI